MPDSDSPFRDLLLERLSRSRERVQVLQRRRAGIESDIEQEEEIIRHLEALLEAERRAFGRVAASEPLPLEAEEQPSFAGMRIRDAIMALLLEWGRAMHADEIRAGLEARGMRFSHVDPKASVVTALVRGHKKGFFQRVSPNTYRLVRMPGQTELGASQRVGLGSTHLGREVTTA